MKSDRRAAVAIIGAGFSGTMVAAHLARRGVDTVLVEASDRAGQGTAFSTGEPAHLLNVPAGNMSAWPDSPDDFASRAAHESGEFAERRRFGAYLRSILDEAVSTGYAELVNDRAVGADRDGGQWRVELESGASVTADALVLAIGNQPPAPLDFAQAAGERLIGDPWGAGSQAAIADAARKDEDVLILGTGLTMVDVVLSLDAAGHKGRITALSRRGLAPRSHGEYEPAPVDAGDVPSGNLRKLARWLRRRAAEVGWRAAIDSLRPHSQELWQSLSAREKTMFLRHARPWWDVHRHRIAPEVAKRLTELIAEDRLEVVAGRVTEVRAVDDSVEASIRRRGTDSQRVRRFGYIFNCTGPLHDIDRTRDPLLRNLLVAGCIKSDELGIGLEVDGRSRAEGADRLWALGALTKARYWEIIAVPDIRHQAAQVAEDIATELGR